MDLVEWTSHYIDHINSFKKHLDNKKRQENKIICKFKDGYEITYVVQDILDNQSILETKSEQKVLVCLNRKKNLKFLLENWSKFIQNPRLKIIFSNPELNIQWSLIPHTHNKISDSSSLKKGLKSIFESVPEA